MATATATATAATTAGEPAETAGPTPGTVFIGAGDICVAGSVADAQATAALIAARPNDIVFTAGDNSNEIGSATEYADCVGKSWGAFGVLELTLGARSYSWLFIPVAGATFSDSGTRATHG